MEYYCLRRILFVGLVLHLGVVWWSLDGINISEGIFRNYKQKIDKNCLEKVIECWKNLIFSKSDSSICQIKSETKILHLSGETSVK